VLAMQKHPQMQEVSSAQQHLLVMPEFHDVEDYFFENSNHSNLTQTTLDSRHIPSSFIV
jgi:hypothetical protein